MRLTWKPLLLLLLLLLLANPLSGQVIKATVAVDGMACPFCGYGIEKRLLKVEAVEKVMIDLVAGEAQVIAEPGRSINVQDIRRAVEKAGFTPGSLEIEATGRVVSGPREGEFQLDLEIDEESLPLVDAGDQFVAWLREAPRSGLRVKLRGKIRWLEAGPALSPEHIEEVLE
jgi:mercuric ion binding protein